MTLRLTEEQDRVLQELATTQGVSKHEAVIRAIEAALERHTTRRADLLKRVVHEDAALLDLLAK